MREHPLFYSVKKITANFTACRNYNIEIMTLVEGEGSPCMSVSAILVYRLDECLDVRLTQLSAELPAL
jgi:hypothetical protein